MQKEQCIKVDDSKFRDKLIQNAKELLENGTVRRTSELGRCEAALNGMNRAEVEYDVLAHTRAVLEEMGMENEVTLIGARVYGSRSKEGLYHADSDVDVVVSYRGNIREDTLFNAVNEAGVKIAGLPIDINPVSKKERERWQNISSRQRNIWISRNVQKLSKNSLKEQLRFM